MGRQQGLRMGVGAAASSSAEDAAGQEGGAQEVEIDVVYLRQVRTDQEPSLFQEVGTRRKVG